MGVKYLDFFIRKNVKNVRYKINIIEEINRWKREYCAQPIIVLDIWSLKINICGTRLEQIMGGRQQLQLQKLDTFFSRLIDFGVKLSRTDEVLLRDLDASYRLGIEIFDTIDEHNGSTAFVKNGIDLTANRLNAGLCPESLKFVCSKYGEVKSYTATNYNKELARFATENHALAIVTNNTEFIIFEGKWMFWSSKCLDLDDNTTMEYNRSQLLRALDLNSDQLSLLSTVSGNTVVHFEELAKLHSALRLKHFKPPYFEVLANYVKRLPQQIEKAVVKLSRDIFDSDDEKFQMIVRKSLSLYDTTLYITSDEKEQETDFFLLKSQENRYIYNILKGNKLLITNYLIDLRRTDFMPYYEIIEPMLKRKIGLIRKDSRNDLEYKQTLFAKVKHNEPYREYEILPTYPDIGGLPDFVELMYSDNDDCYCSHSVRVELAKWLIFGDASTDENIEKIPNDYIITILTLKYLLQIDQIRPMEADAILLCVFDVHEEKIDERVLPTIVSTRAIAVSYLYAKMHDQIRFCFEMVGLNKLIANNCSHDGPHFIFLLNDLLSKTHDDYANTVNVIQHLKCFLQS